MPTGNVRALSPDRQSHSCRWGDGGTLRPALLGSDPAVLGVWPVALEGTAVRVLPWNCFLPLRAPKREAGRTRLPRGATGAEQQRRHSRAWVPRPGVHAGWAVDICASATRTALLGPAHSRGLHTHLVQREGRVRLGEDGDPPPMMLAGNSQDVTPWAFADKELKLQGAGIRPVPPPRPPSLVLGPQSGPRVWSRPRKPATPWRGVTGGF